MEQNYKKTRIESDEKRHSSGVVMDQGYTSDGSYAPAMSNGDGIRSRGTRGIMEGLRDIINSSEVVDLTPEIVDPNSVVNARQKKIIDINNPRSIQEDLDSGMEDYSVEDDILE